MWIKDHEGDLINLRRADHVGNKFIEQDEKDKAGFVVYASFRGRHIPITGRLNESESETVMRSIEDLLLESQSVIELAGALDLQRAPK